MTNRLCLLTSFLVICLNGLAQVPSPEDAFGFKPGADYKLADYGQMLDYYRQLDEASDRVRLTEIGKSVSGKPLLLLFISSASNLKDLERWREISEELSRARIDDDRARSLSREGKAVVWVDGGLHATELACGQMTPELAYRMATEESEEMNRIREEVITLLMPIMNPDGLDIVADWYKTVLSTPYETTSPPWLYHHYVGHDNNRDWFMNNMPESRAVSEILYNTWYPQIVYNHHQAAPAWSRIFIPPFAEPVNPNIHPGVTTGVNMVGTAMAKRFAMKKMPGAISRLTYSMWWNGGMRTTPYFHNQIGILTETAHRTPTPRQYPPEEKPGTIRGIPTDGTHAFYPDPWKGGESHFRDGIDYMLTATMATLELAASRREHFLYDIYRMGRDAIESRDSLFAYVIPAEQWDRGEARNLVNILRQGGVEVHKASGSFQAGGKAYPGGCYIIYGAQAFRPYVIDLLEKQEHPDQRQYPGGPVIPPYDIAGWTLPMQMGIRVDKIAAEFTVTAEEIKEREPVPAGRAPDDAAYGYALTCRENASVIAVNRLLKAGESVSISPSTDTYIIQKGNRTASRVRDLAEKLGLDFEPLSAPPSLPPDSYRGYRGLQKLQPVRIGLYKSWVANMDEGWTRWLMESYEFAVDTLHDRDLREKDLGAYQVIILPDQSGKGLLNGHAPGTMPEPYTGGMGPEGVMALHRYVQEGGTLITLNRASDFAIEQLGLPLKNVVSGLSSRQFYIPGSLIRMEADTRHPLACGMQEETAAFFNKHSGAFEPLRKSREGEGGREDTPPAPDPPVEVIATYAGKDLLMSGWALNAGKHIAGKTALVQVNRGKGKIVLFGFPPQFRGQPRGTYKLLFNAILQGLD